MATNVSSFISNIDYKIWKGVEDFSCRSYHHNNFARFFFIPIGVGTLVRDTLAIPIQCIENIIQIAINIFKTPAVGEKRPDTRDCVFNAIVYGLGIPFSPIVGLINAVASMLEVLKSPLKTAKINAEIQTFRRCLGFNWVHTTCFWDLVKLVNLTNKLEYKLSHPLFCYAEWKRFADQVDKLYEGQKLKELAKLHFLQSAEALTAFTNEVGLKVDKVIRGWKSFGSQSIREACGIEEVKKWNQFQRDLLFATGPELEALEFEFIPAPTPPPE